MNGTAEAGKRGPQPSLRFVRIHALSRAAVAFVWIYHGLVPKLIFRDPVESEALVAGGFDVETSARLVAAAGWVEFVFGLLVLAFWRSRWPLIGTIALMAAALVGVTATVPHQLVGAFNPVSLNLLMIALSAVGLLALRGITARDAAVRWQQDG